MGSKSETSTGSEFLSLLRVSDFFRLYSRLLADFLSHLGKWVKLIKFEAENEFFALGRLKNHKVPHLHPNSTMLMPLDSPHWWCENEMAFVSHEVPFPATSTRRSQVAGNGTE